MPQTLTKPVLLDETGQDIAEKLDTNGSAIIDALDDIKDAIGTSSEFIPIAIRVTTPPTKTAYISGEALDLTGIVVNLVASNGAMADITSACIFSPANGAALTSANTSVSVSYYYPKDDYTFTATQNITVKTVSSIAVTTPPTKTVYKTGDALDLTGIVVTASYDGGGTKDVTASCVFSPANGATLAAGTTSVSVSFTEDGVTKTTSQAITVKELASIAVTTPPTETEYAAGDTLDLTGIVVTATYDNGDTADVTSDCTFSPADGATLTASDDSVTVSFSEGGITKTTTQAITIISIYGAEWDGTATTAWTRTDAAAGFSDPNPYYSGMSGTPSSPFDNIQPWAGMLKVSQDAGDTVRIPRFWYKLTQDGNKIKIQIASHAVDGFSVSPAHMDRGDGVGERDVVYIGRYKSSLKVVSGYYTCESETGANPYRTSRSEFRTYSHYEKNNTWQQDFAMRFTIWMLYLVEFADWDSQRKIGYGCGTGSQQGYEYTGYTDNMPYHTGTMKTSRATYGPSTQYRYIEGLWENGVEWLDGCYYNTSRYLNIILNPANFAEPYSQNAVNVGQFCYGGFPKKFTVSDVTGAFPLLVMTETGGSDSTYTTDIWGVGTESPNLLLANGIEPNNSFLENGLFRMQVKSNNDSSTVCSRLMVLPNS